jgi:hypothetical protein
VDRLDVVVERIWYRAMRWQFQRSELVPRNENPAEPTTKQ